MSPVAFWKTLTVSAYRSAPVVVYIEAFFDWYSANNRQLRISAENLLVIDVRYRSTIKHGTWTIRSRIHLNSYPPWVTFGSWIQHPAGYPFQSSETTCSIRFFFHTMEDISCGRKFPIFLRLALSISFCPICGKERRDPFSTVFLLDGY